MAGKPTYKQKYEASEARWHELRDYLQKCADVAVEVGDDQVNYDKTTLLQVLFQMVAMEE